MPTQKNRCGQLTEFERRLGLAEPEVFFDEGFALTDREVQVARLLYYQRSDRQIGQELQIAKSTAEHHVQIVRLKMNLKSRRDIVEHARRSPGPAALRRP